MKAAYTELEHLLAAEIDPAYAGRAEAILTTIENSKPKSVLEVGCGRGFYLQALTHFPFIHTIVGVDVQDDYLARARKSVTDTRVTIKKASAIELPFKNGSFDAVICSEVLEHVPDDALALSEMRRVLKPGGRLIISVPHYHFPFLWDPLNFLLMKLFKTHVNKNIWWLAGIWADHERLYTHEQIFKLVKTQGYKQIKTQAICPHSWPFTHFLLYGLGKNIVERCKVKEFDRFSQDSPKPLSRFIATLFRLPSVMVATAKPKRFVNIFLEATKT